MFHIRSPVLLTASSRITNGPKFCRCIQCFHMRGEEVLQGVRFVELSALWCFLNLFESSSAEIELIFRPCIVLP